MSPSPFRHRFFILFSLLLVFTVAGLWIKKQTFRVHSSPDASPPTVSKTDSDPTPERQAKSSTKSDRAEAEIVDSGRTVSQPGVPNQQALLPVANRGGGEPGISTRARAAGGKTVADILKNKDMSDPDTRARVVAEMRLLEESQEQAVLAKARQLGIQTRIDGPGHKVSILYDFRGDEPLYRTTLNRNAAISSGADLLVSAPYSLTGSGIKVGVWDAGSIRGTHQELTGRVTRKNSSAPFDDHATHVAGTVGASGVQVNAKGMAPQATIDSYDWDADYSEMTAAGAATSGDTTRIPLSNHSYGYDAITADMGRYEAEANSVDAIAASLPYYLPFWAAGNEQDVLTARGGYQSITFNGLAKNIMTIGAVNDAVSGGTRVPSLGTIADFSSLGPCDDGRIKPDLVANGVTVYSSISSSNTAYDGTYSGTSMATPSAMGSAALLEQLYAQQFSGQRLRASTLKALLIHTADNLGTVGPDYTYGWGLINVKAASDLILAHKASLAAPKVIEATLTNSSKTNTHTFIWDGVSPIRATICWTEPAGAVQTAADSRTRNLLHNLDLKITAPDSTTNYQPYLMPFVGTWTQASMALAATTGKNNVDNVEQVYLATPSQPGTYTVTVSLDGNLTTASQIYSLTLTGGADILSNPPPNIALTSPANGSAFLPGAPVTISATATDLALGGGPGAVSQVEFFNGTTSLGVDTSAPYSIVWTPTTSGTFSLTARATDNDNATASSTSVSVTVLSGDGTPVISSFTPASAPVGSLVILAGSNFVNVSAVRFNGVDAVFTIDSAGQITVTVPPLATSGTISVVNSYGTGTSSTSFTLEQLPILISQIYGAGGNSGAALRQDYVELYNRSASPVSLAGWSIQYASSTGSTWSVAPLSGSILPGKYYLLGLAAGSSGSALPTPDASGTIALSATNGKVALTNSTTALSGTSPVGNAALQDFVGFGTANAFEGSAAPSPSTTTAIFRAGAGATDTGNNGADFTATIPNPRNSAAGPAVIPVITSATSATGTVGTSFAYQITAANSPTSFAATGLPTGLLVNTATGAITGTPTAAGTSSVTISAINSAGPGTATLSITINPSGGGSVNLLSENMGVPSGTTTIAAHTFQSTALVFTGTGDVRSTTPSSGYAGASGNGNVFITNSVGTNFVISGINTSGYSGLSLTLGHLKTTNTSSNELVVEVSEDGTTYTPLTYTRPTGTNTSSWLKVSPTGAIPATPNLRIRFRQTSSSAQFRIDDIVLSGTLNVVATPTISTTGTLTEVSSTYGAASPIPTSFTVSGADMTGGILVTAPAGFEVSLAAGSGYAASLTVPGTGIISVTTIYLRLAAGISAGFYSGDVVCSSSGAAPVTLPTTASQVRLKLLTITADDLTKSVGTTLTLGTGQTAFSATGLVGSETIGTVTLTASGGTAAGDPAGIYTLTPSAATGGTFLASNYDLNYIDGILNVTQGSGSTFENWIGTFPALGDATELTDDFDGDGLPNGIENFLGTSPAASNVGLTQVSATPTTLVFRHSRSNTPASDLTANYEWSANLSGWNASAATAGGTTVTFGTAVIVDTEAPGTDLVEVTATISGNPAPTIFVRLKAVK